MLYFPYTLATVLYNVLMILQLHNVKIDNVWLTSQLCIIKTNHIIYIILHHHVNDYTTLLIIMPRPTNGQDIISRWITTSGAYCGLSYTGYLVHENICSNGQ